MTLENELRSVDRELKMLIKIQEEYLKYDISCDGLNKKIHNLRDELSVLHYVKNYEHNEAAVITSCHY